MTIGDRIKEARERRKWTRRKLAERSTYSEMSIWRWETGCKEPSERAIAALEKALGTKLRK